MNHQIHAYWQRFVTTHHLGNAHYDAWAFGDDAETANQLAELVVKGIKTATTSALEDYETNEPLPKVGDYNMILWADGTPACITQTKVVEVVPYKWVSAEHAFHEGEGDRSLTYWRTAHEAFFKNEYQRLKQPFSPNIPCVCELFEVVDRDAGITK